MNGNTLRLALACALVLAPVGCNSGTPQNRTPPPNEFMQTGVRVVSLDVGSSIGPDLKINDNNLLDEFRPEQAIFASVATRGSAPDGTLAAHWTYEDTVPVLTSSRPFRPNGPAVVEFHISHPRGLLPGRYKVEILLDGKVAATRAFRIMQPAAPADSTPI